MLSPKYPQIIIIHIKLMIAKRIIYLDQMLLSNMAKSLDPVWSEESGQQDDYWIKVFDALDRALKLQLIICPYSEIHVSESVVHKHFKILRRLCDHFALATRFEAPYAVHVRQLKYALQAKIDGAQVDYDSILKTEFIHGNINKWSGRINIVAHLPAALPDPALVNQSSNDCGEAFKEIFTRWVRERKTFDEYYQLERKAGAEILRKQMQNYKILQRKTINDEEDMYWLFNEPQWVYSVRTLIETVMNVGVSEQRAYKYVFEFLDTHDALAAPFNEISALLMAALAGRAIMGQKKPPDRGMWNDIKTISAFLPYCDAMFVDNYCAALLRENPLRTKIKYPTKVFSKKTSIQFISYLENLEENAGPNHVKSIERYYGQEWLTPFRNILEWERQQEIRN